METKVLEIRDRATFIPVLAIKMRCDKPNQIYYVHLRCGYPNDGDAIVVIRLDDQRAHADPHDWSGRTMPVAHNHIIEHFDALDDGDVVDVEYILGETTERKVSERLAWRTMRAS